MTVVHAAHERGVTTLTLDSPDTRNALSAVLVGELADALTRCDKDGDVRAVVLTHTGNTFCAGADLRDPRPRRPSSASCGRSSNCASPSWPG